VGNMNRKLLIGVAALALYGCGKVKDGVAEYVASNQPDYVFPPGYKVAWDDGTALVWGNDACPSQSSAMDALFGEAPIAGSTSCILINKDRATVSVHIAARTGRSDEQWAIIHLDPAHKPAPFALRRPNGQYVSAAKS